MSIGHYYEDEVSDTGPDGMLYSTPRYYVGDTYDFEEERHLPRYTIRDETLGEAIIARCFDEETAQEIADCLEDRWLAETGRLPVGG